jgi:hypothetical protein
MALFGRYFVRQLADFYLTFILNYAIIILGS